MEAGSAREGLSGKVIRNLNVVVRSKGRCAVGWTGLTSDDEGMEYVREISTHPSP